MATLSAITEPKNPKLMLNDIKRLTNGISTPVGSAPRKFSKFASHEEIINGEKSPLKDANEVSKEPVESINAQ